MNNLTEITILGILASLKKNIMNTLPILILLGPPGSGKGTQAKQLCNTLHYNHLSTGDLLRMESKKETILGQEIRTYISKGDLVADKTIVTIVLDSIKKNETSRGVILDGFPRTLIQAQLLYKKCGIKNITVFCLEVDDTTIIKRLVQRRVCNQCGQLYHLEFHAPKRPGQCDVCNGKLEQRLDDNEAIIKRRLEIYHKEIPPILEFYQKLGKLIHIKGSEPQKKITTSIISQLHLRAKF